MLPVRSDSHNVVTLPVAIQSPAPNRSARRRLLAGVAGLGAVTMAASAHAQTGTGTSTPFDPTAIVQGFEVNSQSMLTLIADVTPYALAIVGLIAGFQFLWHTLRKA